MNFSFANPALLFGSLLFVVPLIIHLLNRRRFQPIRWAAQEFLLQAYQRTRRRLTLESLLLLLLRCLLIALLAFTLARPFVPSENPLAGLTAAQRNVVLVVDSSYSMTRRSPGGDSALERAKEQAQAVIAQLSQERGDRVGLLTMAARPQQVLAETTRLDLATDAIGRLATDWRRADLQRTLEALDELYLAPATGRRDVYFFTDLQRATFDPASEQRDPAAQGGASEALPAAALRRVASRDATVTIVDVGEPDPTRNLTVESLEPDPRNVVQGEVVTFTATVRNHGGVQQQGVTGSFVLDGRTEQAKASSFDVPAHGVASVEFSTVLRQSGFATVEFQLLEDELAADDRRSLAFPVREAVSVLIVDGHYDRGDDLRASAKLELMLDPDGDADDGGSIYRVAKVIDDRRFNLGAENLADYDLIALVDVPQVDEKVAQELEQAVRAGAGLLVYLGELTDARAWNERLWREDGSGLLPARLLEPKGDERADASAHFLPRLDDLGHPIVRLFRSGPLTQNLRLPVMRFWRTEIGPADVATTRVLSLEDDPVAPSALILEKPAGHGRVVLVTTSADSSWAAFANDHQELTYLPLVQETAGFLTLPDLTAFNVGVGDRLRRTVRSIPSSIAVLTPSGERLPLEANFEQREHGRYVLPPFDRTAVPGLYALELEFPLASGAGASAGAREVVRYAVNLDVAESELLRIEREALAALYPNVKMQVVDRVEERADQAATAREGELWRPLLWLLLALLASEMAVAAWLGRKSQGGSAPRPAGAALGEAR